MKIVITTIAIAGNLLLLSCAKERTCKCTVKVTSTETTTARSGGQPTTEVHSSTTESADSFSKIKKSEMRRIVGCNSRTETSSNTYTTMVAVSQVTTFGGVTYTTTEYVPGDVRSDDVSEYDCKID